MREFAQSFYRSKQWKRVRAAVMARAHGLCEICGKPAKIVHHKVWLNENNINDVTVTLDWDNLMAVCHNCHDHIHQSEQSEERCVIFDDEGNIIIKDYDR